MWRARFPVALVAALVLMSMAAPARAGLYPDLWERYYQLYEGQGAADAPMDEAAPGEAAFPGRVVGQWDEAPLDTFQAPWPQRGQTYELLFATSKDLARSIYGLALVTHDLDPSVDLTRFEAGAQGFHYSMDQVTDWANAVLAGECPLYTGEEMLLLAWLLEDGALEVAEGRVAATGAVGHVLGAAAGRSRPMALNLNHERLHVLWDESTAFNLEWHARWNDLSDEQREAVFDDLSGYDRDNLEGIIEEWSVRSNEAEQLW